MSRNFKKIEDRLYQGGMPNRSNGGWGPVESNPPNWAVVSLDSYGLEDLQLGFRHLRVDIPDQDFPGLTWLRMVVSCIEAFDQAGLNIYIHCYAGISRSAMVTAAFLMKKYKWTPDQALEHVAKGNSGIDPNPFFVRGLKEWHCSLQGYKDSKDEWDIDNYG